MLCVHNLARSAQAVELDLLGLRGALPGRDVRPLALPADRRAALSADAAPRGFFWFLLTSRRGGRWRGAPDLRCGDRRAATRGAAARGRARRVGRRAALVRLEVARVREFNVLDPSCSTPATPLLAVVLAEARLTPAPTSSTSCRSRVRAARLGAGSAGVICATRRRRPLRRAARRGRRRAAGALSSRPAATIEPAGRLRLASTGTRRRRRPRPRGAACARWAPSSPTPRSCSTSASR